MNYSSLVFLHATYDTGRLADGTRPWPGENALENPRTRAMCAQLQAKWPSLLGDGPSGCSWE
jgi:hypothetical protein